MSLSNLTATLSEDTDTTAAIKVADITLSDDGLGTNNLTLAGADAAMFSIVGSELFLNAGASLSLKPMPAWMSALRWMIRICRPPGRQRGDGHQHHRCQ